MSFINLLRKGTTSHFIFMAKNILLSAATYCQRGAWTGGRIRISTLAKRLRLENEQYNHLSDKEVILHEITALSAVN
jgi:hypothetical protein